MTGAAILVNKKEVSSVAKHRAVKLAAWRACTHTRLSFVVFAGEISAHMPSSHVLSLSVSCGAMFICLQRYECMLSGLA